jgi:hypothetical protein
MIKKLATIWLCIVGLITLGAVGYGLFQLGWEIVLALTLGIIAVVLTMICAEIVW